MTIETTADRIEREECEQLQRANQGELTEMLAEYTEAMRVEDKTNRQTLDAMTEPFHCTPYATSQEADIGLNEVCYDDRNLFRILIDTLEVLGTKEVRQQYLDRLIRVLDETVPGSDARAYRVSKVSLEAIEVCTCCGSGLNTVQPCKECGELVCQDCYNGHVCNLK